MVKSRPHDSRRVDMGRFCDDSYFRPLQLLAVAPFVPVSHFRPLAPRPTPHDSFTPS